MNRLRTQNLLRQIYTTTLNEISLLPSYTPSPQVLVETQNSMQSPISKQIALAMGSNTEPLVISSHKSVSS